MSLRRLSPPPQRLSPLSSLPVHGDWTLLLLHYSRIVLTLPNIQDQLVRRCFGKLAMTFIDGSRPLVNMH